MTKHATTGYLAIALCAIAFFGCSQQPDAVRLTVTPEKEIFARGEPVVLRTHLVGTNGNVALHRSFFYNVRLRRDGTLIGASGNTPLFCGTGGIEAMPLWPFIWVGSLLDVADLAGRFVVLTKGKECSHKVLIRPESLDPTHQWVFEPTDDMKEANDDTPWEKWVLPKESLAPGRYHAHVQLINKRSSSSVVVSSLPPLLWKPYEPTIEAETELTVAE